MCLGIWNTKKGVITIADYKGLLNNIRGNPV